MLCRMLENTVIMSKGVDTIFKVGGGGGGGGGFVTTAREVRESF